MALPSNLSIFQLPFKRLFKEFSLEQPTKAKPIVSAKPVVNNNFVIDKIFANSN
jgi:hypothetical protein